MQVRRLAEAVVVGAMGAALAWIVVGLVDDGWLRTAATGVAAANGLVAGVVGLYSWHRRRGWLFFALDSTWGLFGNALALLIHGWNIVRGPSGYVLDMCRRTNRHVYEAGFGLRTNFAFAQGNVISNAGGTVGLRGESEKSLNRRKFVVAHEGVHVLQNRIFGPLFQGVYVAWMAVASVVGLVIWLVRERRDLGKIIETLAYYNNPFEYWAYRNDHYWPPRGALTKYAWGPVDLR